MARYGTMQLSNELRIRNSHQCCNHHTSIMGKSQLHMFGCNLSSHSLAFLTGGGNETSILKYATAILTRSYDALRSLNGSPLLLKLIPAVGTMVFAAWGLGPLMRMGRTIFLRVQNNNDSNWKKSSTHHLMTYLQPLLLWTGATFICRALDPVVLPTVASQAVKQRLLNFVRSLSTVLAFAYCLSSLIQQAQTFFMDTNDPSDARNMGFSFAGKAIYTAVWVAAASLFMELLGFSAQRWLTAGGLGTVLLTLAGREIFTNFLSSVMIHATRPFVLGDWIQTKIQGYEVSGTVEHVGWWSPTIIRADDREAVHIPSHKFTVNVVRNLSRKTHWRIKTHIAISHLDVNKINNIVADMRKVLAKNPQVEQQKLHRRVFLESINAENQALMILISCFVKTSHFEEYLCVKEVIILDLLRVISHHRARLAVPIRTVQKIFSEADLENIPFAETNINHSKAAYNRPFLLIEPSYKINSNDKVKASARSVSASVEENADSITESIADNKTGSTSDLESKKVNIVAASLNANSIANPKSSVASASNPQMAAGSTSNISETQKETRKGDTGDASTEGTVSSPENRTGRVTPATSSSISESGSENINAYSSALQMTRNGEKPLASSRGSSHLEDNIVLGVALDGSKRTLPIEDEGVPSSAPAESKDLAANRNASGSAFVSKDKKDNQAP